MTLYTSGIVWAVSIYYGYKMPCEKLKFAIECSFDEKILD